MFRIARWSTAAALALTLAAPALYAQHNMTVVLKSGDRHASQNIAFRVDKGSVGTWRVGDVAYVDFGGTPDVAVNISGTEEAVVLREGRVIKGQILELGMDPATRDYLVIVRDQSGQEQRFMINQVGRVYFAGGTAAPAAAPAATTGTAATTSATSAGGIVVSGRQQWTSTGLMVRRGEVLQFNTTGNVQLSGDSADLASAAGSKAARMAAANAPLPGLLSGALIGRIGNGRPFAIGDQTSIPMPDGGQLFLGINDDHVGDNSGEFRVEITRSGRRR